MLEGVAVNDDGRGLDLVVGQPTSFLHEVNLAPRLGSDVLHTNRQLVDDLLENHKKYIFHQH